MRFTLTHLLTLFLLGILSAPSALAAPTIPGIGRHRNPATVAGRTPTLNVAVGVAERSTIEIPAEVAGIELKRADLAPEYERRLEAAMDSVVRDMGEAKERNEQKKKRRTRLARFHP